MPNRRFCLGPKFCFLVIIFNLIFQPTQAFLNDTKFIRAKRTEGTSGSVSAAEIEGIWAAQKELPEKLEPINAKTPGQPTSSWGMKWMIGATVVSTLVGVWQAIKSTETAESMIARDQQQIDAQYVHELRILGLEKYESSLRQEGLRQEMIENLARDEKVGLLLDDENRKLADEMGLIGQVYLLRLLEKPSKEGFTEGDYDHFQNFSSDFLHFEVNEEPI